MSKPAKSVANSQKEPAICVADDPVLFNGKDIRTVYPISTFSGTTQDELVELIRQVQVRAQVNRGEDAYGVQVRAQVEVQDKVQVEGDMDVTRKTKKRIKEANQ